MKILIVEDDFTSRKLLQKLLQPYGEADIAVNGKEAINAFEKSLSARERYDLVCLDIMMPEADGHEVLREIRRIEEQAGVLGQDGVRVIMTTAIREPKHAMQAFREQCEGYLLKPIDRDKLLDLMRFLRLIQ